MYDECLNGGSTWGPGSEEHDFQQCDACGWMPGQPTDENLTGDDEEDFPDGSLDY